MARLLSLPDEILLEILDFLYLVDDSFIQYGDKNDIVATRLVCRRLAMVGDIIFEHIKFLVDDVGFLRLLELSRSSLCKRVRKLSCYFEVTGDHRFQSLLELAKRDTLSLADTLRQFQNLRAIEIWQNWRSSWFGGLGDGEAHDLTAYPIGYRLLQNVAHVLGGIEGLTLRSDRVFCPEWNLSAPPWAFPKVKRLKVALTRLAGGNGIGEYGLNSRGLKALIELSPQLEELELSIDMGFSTEPFVPDFDIPKLQYLVLDRLLFQDISVLVGFLGRHLVTLKSVELHKVTLIDSSRILSQEIFGEVLSDTTVIII
jgi:hypothetical protein